MRATVGVGTHWETPQVRVIELSPTQGGRFDAAPCGSYIEIEVPQEGWRSYSLLHQEEGHGYRVAVQRAQGAASSWLTDSVQVGQDVGLRGPHPGFDLAPGDARVLMVAGGIGITPFLGMIQALEQQQRDWRLVYAVRSRALAPFAEELARYGPRVQWHVDEDQGRWLDVQRLFETIPRATHVYACGPQPLMQAVELQRQARPDLRFHEQQTVRNN